MFNRLRLSLLAGTLALTPAIAPTQAPAATDTGKIIGGLAIGAILGAVIANELDDRKDRRKGINRRAHDFDKGRGHRYDGWRHDRHKGYQRHQRSHDGYRPRRVDLPGACRLQRGHSAGYSGRCLRRHDIGRRALPAACAVHIGGRHGTIYRDRCLAHHGQR